VDNYGDISYTSQLDQRTECLPESAFSGDSLCTLCLNINVLRDYQDTAIGLLRKVNRPWRSRLKFVDSGQGKSPSKMLKNP